MFGEQCNGPCLIYKGTWTVDGKHYIGETQNDVKGRIYTYLTDMGKFLTSDNS